MDFEENTIVEAISSARTQPKYMKLREYQQLVVKMLCLPSNWKRQITVTACWKGF